MRILWLYPEKTETEWGVFKKGDLIDTNLAGIPDQEVWDMVQAGIVEVVNPEPEPEIKKWWNKEKKEIAPIEEKLEPEEDENEDN